MAVGNNADRVAVLQVILSGQYYWNDRVCFIGWYKHPMASSRRTKVISICFKMYTKRRKFYFCVMKIKVGKYIAKTQWIDNIYHNFKTVLHSTANEHRRGQSSDVRVARCTHTVLAFVTFLLAFSVFHHKKLKENDNYVWETPKLAKKITITSGKLQNHWQRNAEFGRNWQLCQMRIFRERAFDENWLYHYLNPYLLLYTESFREKVIKW